MRITQRLQILWLFLGITSAVSAADFFDEWPGIKDAKATELEKVIRGAERIEVFSLHPYPELDASGKMIDHGEGRQLHQWRILGKGEVVDAAEKDQLAVSLGAGIRANDGNAALCFSPRHAMRCFTGEKHTDIIICFECWQLRVGNEGEKYDLLLTTGEPAAEFDRVFKARGASKKSDE